MHPKFTKQNGFTLIELMITVAIVGILAAIALPSYRQYVTQSRRTSIEATMMQLALAQEKLRVNCAFYAGAFYAGVDPTITFVCGTDSASSQVAFPTTNYDNAQYYTLALSNATGTTYTITAAASGSSQASDTGCTTLTLNEKGDKGPSACWKK